LNQNRYSPKRGAPASFWKKLRFLKQAVDIPQKFFIYPLTHHDGGEQNTSAVHLSLVTNPLKGASNGERSSGR
jgi:hypothetical protein